MAENIITKIYTDEDKRLLEIPLPDSPCLHCPDTIGCCGCPAGNKYYELIKPYKDSNVYDEAIIIKSIIGKIEMKYQLENEILKLLSKLPKDIHHIPTIKDLAEK